MKRKYGKYGDRLAIDMYTIDKAFITYASDKDLGGGCVRTFVYRTLIEKSEEVTGISLDKFKQLIEDEEHGNENKGNKRVS